MASEIFRFKKFELRHSSSSMPVGTDGVLLGAWADVTSCSSRPEAKILDVGCGCGLIALMLAQRCPLSRVEGIDIDEASVIEATGNAQASPFADRVCFHHADVIEFSQRESAGKYDLVVCNPPYYTEDTTPPDVRRSMARNSVHLSFENLLCSVGRLLADDGVFSVVIPMNARDIFVTTAMLHGMRLRRECRVRTVLRKTSKRVLLEFGNQVGIDVSVNEMLLQGPNGERSPEYADLCKDFYL